MKIRNDGVRQNVRGILREPVRVWEGRRWEGGQKKKGRSEKGE